MARKIGCFVPNGLSKPSRNDGAIHAITVSPLLFAGVVRRINAGTLDLPGVVREQRLERDEVVALHDEVAAAGIADGKLRNIFEKMKRHLVVVIHHGFFANPVECGHGLTA